MAFNGTYVLSVYLSSAWFVLVPSGAGAFCCCCMIVHCGIIPGIDFIVWVCSFDILLVRSIDSSHSILMHSIICMRFLSFYCCILVLVALSMDVVLWMHYVGVLSRCAFR